MGALKMRQQMLAPELLDPISVRASEPGAGVALDDKPVLIRRMRLTLTAATLSVLAANDYGSLKVCDLPDRNMLLLAVEADVVLTKQGNTNGIVAATDMDVGMGTAPASNVTLATTMIDILEKVDLDADAATASFQRHSNDQATAVFPKRLADSATQALYLNVGLPNLITADSSLSCTGTIDVWYIDLGKKV